MGTFCPFCMAIDSSALVLAVVAVLRARSGWDPPESVRARALVGSAFVAAVAVTLGLGFTRKVPVPAPIAAEMALTPPGQITIVDFVDFECPFCRETHAELRPVLEAHKGKIRLVRKQVPLARIHPHAMDAARAACCGEQLGKGEAMAEALFSTPAEELTGDGCVRLAETLGLDGARFRACLSDPATEARIQADTEAFRAAAGRGLPTLFINERRLEGAQDQATLEEAVRGALGS
jgi:protein-disulfide isomerase